MKLLTAIVIAAAALVTTPALAGTELDLATKSACMGCHAIDKKIVGPSYKDVAAKYKATDEAKLVEKVAKGGGGVWGPIPMPQNSPKVPDADIKILVKWILAGAPK